MPARRIQSSWDFRRPHKASGELANLTRKLSRVGLLHSRLRLLCLNGHGVQSCKDIFSSCEALLDCGCRRPLEPGLRQKVERLELEVEAERIRRGRAV
jgi:hypothetical protein